jgi:hypothetical protein
MMTPYMTGGGYAGSSLQPTWYPSQKGLSLFLSNNKNRQEFSQGAPHPIYQRVSQLMHRDCYTQSALVHERGLWQMHKHA